MRHHSGKTTLARLGALLVPALLGASLATPAAAQRPDQESLQRLKQSPKQLLEMIDAYLVMVEKMRAATSDPLTTQIIAQHDLKEIYEKLGKPEDGVKEFRAQLEQTKDPDARISLRFTISDLLKSSGKTDEALTELRAIMNENRARYDRKK